MILTLDANQLLRLSQACGATVEVLDGCVRITEAGGQQDAVMSRGMRYSIAGDGLVVVGAAADPVDGAARIELRPPLLRRLLRVAVRLARALGTRWHEYFTIAALERLSDHQLRDIGLMRDQIPSDQIPSDMHRGIFL